jgi:hypothetical protein
MYLRIVKRRNKDGSEVSYVQLAHNVWDPDKQRSRAQVIHNLGREDQLDGEALRRLVGSITRFLDPGQALCAQAPEGTSFLRSVPMGGAWALDHLWRRLGIGEAIAGVARSRRVTEAVERLLFALVANRALDPMSKLAAVEWAQNDTWLPGVGEWGGDPQIFYRAMDFLLDCDEQIQREVFFQVSDLLNLQVDLVLFDTTWTYFEIPAERGDHFRKFGESKDKRWDLPQVVVGFAVTRRGSRCAALSTRATRGRHALRSLVTYLREAGAMALEDASPELTPVERLGRADSTRCTGRGRRDGVPGRSADSAWEWAACAAGRDGCSDDSAALPRSDEAASARRSRGRSPWRRRAWRANSTQCSALGRAASRRGRSRRRPRPSAQKGGGVRERRCPRAARSPAGLERLAGLATGVVSTSISSEGGSVTRFV